MNNEELVETLAKMYKENYLLIAKLCDEHIDRSGRLLGEVRYKAVMLNE